MADALALEPQVAAPGTYRQRGANSLQRLFRTHFPEFYARYEVDYARRMGRSRLQRITRADERFLECGDYTKGVARIHCTNPDCRAECFRPFSYKVFYEAHPAVRRVHERTAAAATVATANGL